MQIYLGRPIPLSLPIHHILLALKFATILLIQWVLWFIPAVSDAFDEYSGDEYRGIIVLILSSACLFSFAMPWLLYSDQVVTVSISVNIGITMYLFFGILYFLHERKWS